MCIAATLADSEEMPLMLPDAGSIQVRILRIAVVDDDASVRNGLCRMARAFEIECTTFESGESLLAFQDIGRFDFLVLDIQLPGIDGFETSDRLEDLGLLLPIVFITAHSDINSDSWQRQLRGRRCLTKPFDEADLIEAISVSRRLES